MFASMGMSTNKKYGKAYVADERKIRLHNLSTHLLLGKENLGEMKSSVVC